MRNTPPSLSATIISNLVQQAIENQSLLHEQFPPLYKNMVVSQLNKQKDFFDKHNARLAIVLPDLIRLLQDTTLCNGWLPGIVQNNSISLHESIKYISHCSYDEFIAVRKDCDTRIVNSKMEKPALINRMVAFHGLFSREMLDMQAKRLKIITVNDKWSDYILQKTESAVDNMLISLQNS